MNKNKLYILSGIIKLINQLTFKKKYFSCEILLPVPSEDFCWMNVKSYKNYIEREGERKKDIRIKLRWKKNKNYLTK